MNVAVYVPSTRKKRGSNFIVETFFPLFEELSDHRFILITDADSESELATDFEKMTIRAQPRNPLLKRLWIERTLAGLLKKINADVFISADNFCSLNTPIPQVILMPAREKLKPAYAKKARLLIVTNELTRIELIGKLKIGKDKIAVVYPSPGKSYLLLGAEQRESLKTRWAGGKEYFLYNTRFQKEEDLIDLLKSFSHFKKRQQSGFKLLISGKNDPSLQNTIANYKYRNDVVLLTPASTNEEAAITAAAYAVILSFNDDEDIGSALNAMQSGVPVIAINDRSINEIGENAFLYSGNEIKEIGEKMMQLYRDEDLRSQMIEKGQELVKNFTVKKSADQLWQRIKQAMN